MNEYKFKISSKEGTHKVSTTAENIVAALKILTNAEKFTSDKAIIDIKIKKIPMIKVKFKKWNCIAVFKKYADNHRTAIELEDEKTGEPIAIASVNLSEKTIHKNEIAIKDYSENEGMVKALTEAGIIGDLIYSVQRGFVKIGIYQLLKTK